MKRNSVGAKRKGVFGAMTDKQIIEAFKCCIDGKCGSCPFLDGCNNNPFEISLAVYDLKLLKAQKAEIERLTEQLKTARADAIMEFANRLCADYKAAYPVYGIERLDDVVIMSIAKEMTEGEG